MDSEEQICSSGADKINKKMVKIKVNNNKGPDVYKSIADVETYLHEIKSLVRENQYTLSKREKNENFTNPYNLNSEAIRNILLNLEYSDCFCISHNNHAGKENEILYEFSKTLPLDDREQLKYVDIYIKTNLVQTRSRKNLIVVSLHEREQEVTYLFI